MLGLSLASPSNTLLTASKPISSSNPNKSSIHGIPIKNVSFLRMPSSPSSPLSSSSSTSSTSSSSVVMMAKRQEELNEIRSKTTEELNEEVIDLKGELLMLRLQKSARKDFKSSEFRRMRKKVENFLGIAHIHPEGMAMFVEQHLVGNVLEGYETMQWERINRGEPYIDDWPSMKKVLQSTFHHQNQFVTISEVKADHETFVVSSNEEVCAKPVQIKTVDIFNTCKEKPSMIFNFPAEEYVSGCDIQDTKEKSVLISTQTSSECPSYEDPFSVFCEPIIDSQGDIRYYVQQLPKRAIGSYMFYEFFHENEKRYLRHSQKLKLKTWDIFQLDLSVNTMFAILMHNTRAIYLTGELTDENKLLRMFMISRRDLLVNSRTSSFQEGETDVGQDPGFS